ncbi:hypothetical protein HN011_005371 [Eciton burchellii]|nr:hypothetical protein HN011_005371 [Eciton burchellii]
MDIRNVRNIQNAIRRRPLFYLRAAQGRPTSRTRKNSRGLACLPEDISKGPTRISKGSRLTIHMHPPSLPCRIQSPDEACRRAQRVSRRTRASRVSRTCALDAEARRDFPRINDPSTRQCCLLELPFDLDKFLSLPRNRYRYLGVARGLLAKQPLATSLLRRFGSSGRMTDGAAHSVRDESH